MQGDGLSVKLAKRYSARELRDLLHNLYWDKGLSLSEIADQLGVTKTTVWRWMVKLHVPRKQLKEAWESKRDAIIYKNRLAHIDKTHYEPDLSPSPDLAYIVGVYLGDGYACLLKASTHHIEYEVGLWTIDECFAGKFARALQNIGLRVHFLKSVRRGKPYYEVKVFSKRLYSYLTSIKLSRRRKLISFNVTELKKVAEMHPIPLIEGFYESEGSLVRCRVHNRCYYRVSLTNANRELLLYLKDLLNRFGFDFNLYRAAARNTYYLVLCKQEQIKKFFSLIHPCMDRKIPECLRN
jgi:intein-encoded DNA endonuclease-like protein